MAARAIPGYTRIAIIAYTGPANGDSARKPAPESYYRSDDYIRHTLAQKLMKEIGQAEAKTMYFFDKLPIGLVGWENQRPFKAGSRNSESIDRFIYGHPKGPLETIDRQYDHIKFLYYYGTPSPTNPCPCHRCSRKRTGAETGIPRTTTPVPCPQAQITSVQDIPEDLRRLKLVELVKALSSGAHLGHQAQQPQTTQQPLAAQYMQQPRHMLLRPLPQALPEPRQPLVQSFQQPSVPPQVLRPDLQQARLLQEAQHVQKLQQLQLAQYWRQFEQKQGPWQAQYPQAFDDQMMPYSVQQQSMRWEQTLVDPQLTGLPTLGSLRQTNVEMSPGIMESPRPHGPFALPPPSEVISIKRELSGTPQEAPRSKGKKRALEDQLYGEDPVVISRKKIKSELDFGISDTLPTFIEGFEPYAVAADTEMRQNWGSFGW